MKKYIFIVLAVALLTSCGDLLTTSPSDQIASANMWTSESLADQGMNGLYRNFYCDDVSSSRVYLGSGSPQGFIRQGFVAMEFQSCAYDGTLAVTLTNATKSASENIIKYEWQWAYTGIHRINDAIENLKNAGLSDEKYERYLCEAKFLRAWYYSRLNKIYHGVPIYLEVISNEECTKGQSTSAEVWDVVLSDLNDCIENDNFPTNTLSSNYGRPSKGAAYALRGQAYMWLAWENNEDSNYYQLAANDFEKVAECGYGLWTGDYIDFFNYENEKDHEMIFPIQFTEDSGYCDYMQLLLGTRDTYEGWSELRPTADFVNYFQNADGTAFNWEDRIPEWNNSEFQDNFLSREVFFLRDSISLDSDGNVVQDYWDETAAGQIKERIQRIGVDVFNKYYLKDGNEDRIRSCYNDRDPRLKEIVLTPYDPYDTYVSGQNNSENCIGKELRWPYINRGTNGGDVYIGNSEASMYIYKKYVYNLKDQIADRLRCPTDWPLIRYTDVDLLLAECYVHLGQYSNAATIVNAVRSRAGMPSVTIGSFDEGMEAVKYERRVELCLESQDYFDEWRWGTYKESKFQGNDVYGVTSWWGEWDGYVRNWYYSDIMYPWPAPSSECERNSNLVRTDGWAY